jgi:hypothetical protein
MLNNPFLIPRPDHQAKDAKGDKGEYPPNDPLAEQGRAGASKNHSFAINNGILRYPTLPKCGRPGQAKSECEKSNQKGGQEDKNGIPPFSSKFQVLHFVMFI